MQIYSWVPLIEMCCQCIALTCKWAHFLRKFDSPFRPVKQLKVRLVEQDKMYIHGKILWCGFKSIFPVK